MSSFLEIHGRREFVRGMIVGAAAVAVGCDGTMTGTPADGSTPRTDGGTRTGDSASGNAAPVWSTIPPITFTQGVAATISIAAYVSDADGDTLTVMKNDVALPPGVTFDAVDLSFVYDGVGAVATTEGHILTADDGRV
jgi:hypothetical protein